MSLFEKIQEWTKPRTQEENLERIKKQTEITKANLELEKARANMRKEKNKNKPKIEQDTKKWVWED